MTSTTVSRPTKTAVWTARVIGALVVLFLLFDAFTKFTKPAPVVDAFTRIGVPIGLSPVIGGLLLAFTVLYVIPRTSVLGAILMTGYLGGAVAIQLRAGTPPFENAFPIIFAALMWTPVYLVNEPLRKLVPLRRT
jgi:hypothetical protein